jgi:hypothetical protein
MVSIATKSKQHRCARTEITTNQFLEHFNRKSPKPQNKERRGNTDQGGLHKRSHCRNLTARNSSKQKFALVQLLLLIKNRRKEGLSG